ncbi:hypothetical protein [Tunturiibacter lichenicola]|uniref:hypothetical protein n=1 Tax=Tunturiibacter lichenicola TaxID=2051959 RepID=UPI003D9BF465
MTAPNETSPPDDGTAVSRRDGQRFQFLVDRRGCEVPQIIDRNIELYVSIIAFQFVLPEEFLKKNGPTVQISLGTMMTVWSGTLVITHIWNLSKNAAFKSDRERSTTQLGGLLLDG